MSLRRRQQCIHAQAVWMLSTLVLLLVLGAFSLELFYSLSLIGFLVIVEVTAPIAVTPRWRSRLRWFVIGGVIGFGYIVARRLLVILADLL